MICRRHLMATLALLPLAAAPTLANTFPRYSKSAFDEAQKGGKSILVVVSAPWCPTCKTQDPIIKKLLSETKYKDVMVFEVDFDSEKDILRGFRANKQSTLIGFKGSKETGRSVGDTSPLSIEDLIEATL